MGTKPKTTTTTSKKVSQAAQAIQQHRQNERHNASSRIPFLREELATVDKTNGIPFLRGELQVLQKTQQRPQFDALVMDVDAAMKSIDEFVTTSLANKTSDTFSSSDGYWYSDRQNQNDVDEDETEN